MNDFKKVSSFNNYYELDSFFKFYIEDMKSKNGLFFYPNLEELIEQYSKKLKQASAIRDIGNYQFFRKIFNFPGECFYVSEWNIQKAISFSRRNLEEKELPVDVLLRFNEVHKEGLESQRLESVNLDDPIIVVYYAPNQEIVIIDGNHRFDNAVRHKVKSISTYTLYPNVFLDILSCDVCRVLYKVHNNMNIMANIANGNLSKDEDPMTLGLDYFFELNEL